jgi:hypothetical protein
MSEELRRTFIGYRQACADGHDNDVANAAQSLAKSVGGLLSGVPPATICGTTTRPSRATC